MKILFLHQNFPGQFLHLAPELARTTVNTEAVREVPASTIAAYREAGFLRVLQPKKFGGLQGSFGTFSRIVEELEK